MTFQPLRMTYVTGFIFLAQLLEALVYDQH